MRTEKRRCVEFIIQADEQGERAECTCDPDALNNAFNSHPDRPSYFAPVFFRRAVLDRYYALSDLYTVGEAGLSCSAEWNIRLDASRSDYVVVMLGDLGKYLPYEDQLHWRSCNVPPQGGFTQEFIDRNFHNRPSCWVQPDHAFIDRLSGFKMGWRERFGWPLFRDLDEGDQYLLDALHIPLQGTQDEFDKQVLALAKILCDSINSQKLLTLIDDADENRQLKSLQRLEKWLEQLEVEGYDSQVWFLRGLQSLRSSGSAHGKGSNYYSAMRRLGLTEMSLDDAFAELLVRARQLVDYLDDALLKGREEQP